MGQANEPTRDANTVMLAQLHEKSITFEYCTSTEWGSVGKELASNPQLLALTLVHCCTSDAFYEELTSSKSLLRLRIGMRV